MSQQHPVLVIHGGLTERAVKGRHLISVQESLHIKLESVFTKLNKGMSALEAVTLACAAMEDDPLYNAGYGSKIQSDGKIRMSASIMDGFSRRFGGCVNVEGVKNPIYLAHDLMKEKDRVLSGQGAARFAKERGLPFSSPFTPHQRAAFQNKKRGKSGTIGAVALDLRGRLAAGTSTGGKGFEYPFRVSDSPTCAGNFASAFCAVSATGTGEEIVEQAAASTLCAFVEAGLSLNQALNKLVSRSRRFDAEFGFIAVDRHGNFKVAQTTQHVIWGAANRRGIKLLK
jgi:L-asparaginase